MCGLGQWNRRLRADAANTEADLSELASVDQTNGT
jgi:hypothetical protein